MKKLTKVLLAALAIVTLGISVATPASAATVIMLIMTKQLKPLEKISNKVNLLKQMYKLDRK